MHKKEYREKTTTKHLNILVSIFSSETPTSFYVFSFYFYTAKRRSLLESCSHVQHNYFKLRIIENEDVHI